jgi:hypothetical protein
MMAGSVVSFPVSYKTNGHEKLTPIDQETISHIQELNEGYGRAYLNSDVEWYAKMLAEDFQCITSSGVILNKQAFLKANTQPVVLADFRFEEVDIRLFGDVAVIHAMNPYETPDGKTGATRYTDIWARRDGTWKTISAQITKIA